MLTNMLFCPVEDDFCDMHKDSLKTATVQHYVMWSIWANLISQPPPPPQKNKYIFPPAGHSYSEWFYSSHIFRLWISYMFQICICQGPRTRWGKVALTLDNPTGKILSIRLDMWHNKHWLLEGKWIWCFMCSMEMVAKYVFPRCNVRLYVSIWSSATPNWIYEDCLKLPWNK